MIFLSRDKGLKLVHSQVRKYVHRTNSGNVTEGRRGHPELRVGRKAG
jgi:hypothetical protein